MEYREHQGMEISEIGIGCYSLSGAYGSKDVEQIKGVIEHAYRLGVNFFDTAEAYGDAEKILGETIKPFRSKVILSTKVGVKDNGEADLSYNYLLSACDESLKRLASDYIDIYNIHFDDPDTPVVETIQALEDLKKTGKIREYGLGHLSPGRVLEYFKNGDVFSVLMELSPISRKPGRDILPLAREHQAGGIAFSVTGRGLLTGEFNKNTRFEEGDIRNIDPQFQKERLEYGLKVMQKLKDIGERYNKTPVQVAIAWVLAQPGIISALIGPSTIEHLEDDLGGSGWSLSKGVLTEINIFLKNAEENLKQEQRETVTKIINQKLSGDKTEAFLDLVYSIETAIYNDYVREEEILPTFYRLFKLKTRLAEINLSELEDIQQEIKNRIVL